MQGAARTGQLLECAKPLAAQGALFERAAALCAGGTVVVSGEADINKTALVEHFLGPAVHARRFPGGCEALATPRLLGPVHDFAGDLPAAVRRMLEGSTNRAALFARIFDELLHGAGAALVVLEDVHWADAATLYFVKFIGRRIRPQAVLIVLAARDDAASWEALAPTLADLRARQLTRIDLQPLSLQAVGRLAGPGAIDARALHEAAGGDPVFVAEVLRGRALPARAAPVRSDSPRRLNGMRARFRLDQRVRGRSIVAATSLATKRSVCASEVFNPGLGWRLNQHNVP